MKRTLVTAALAALSIIGSAHAVAEPSDVPDTERNYLVWIKNQNIPLDPSTALMAGKQVCELLRQGIPFSSAAGGVEITYALTPEDGLNVANDARWFLCHELAVEHVPSNDTSTEEAPVPAP